MAIVLITGSNGGFGEAAALAFARAGDTVYASMRDLRKGKALQQRARGASLDVRLLALDVTQPDTFALRLDAIVVESGRIDILVNNAGLLLPGALEDLPTNALRQVMETNFFGPLLLTRALLPHMRRQRSGCIIMMSSLSGIAGLPGDVIYTASKFALEGATEALRHEVDRFGIRLALVEPALYATKLFEKNRTAGDDQHPRDSPYRALVEHQLKELHARLPQAHDPASVGELLVRISRSDERRLRWPADELATSVMDKLFGMDDSSRDDYLREIAGTRWWSEGRDAPPPDKA